jgi:hypothetical protein
MKVSCLYCSVATKMGHAFLFLDKCKESLIVVSTNCCAVKRTENVFQHAAKFLKEILFSKSSCSSVK